MPLRRLKFCAALLLGLVAWAPAASAEDPITVVELFTSQGCSSCPPADAFQGELAQRSDVLALSFHVDYWDYIGWKDPFSSPEASARQRAYARFFHSGHVYTPQMVIDGRYGEVGSHRGKVLNRMKVSRENPKATVRVDVAPETLTLHIGSYDRPLERQVGVYLVMLDGKHQTQVRRGENAGKMLDNYNVVRALRWVGDWNGKAMEISINRSALPKLGDRYAVLLQSALLGPIYGAALTNQ